MSAIEPSRLSDWSICLTNSGRLNGWPVVSKNIAFPSHVEDGLLDVEVKCVGVVEFARGFRWEIDVKDSHGRVTRFQGAG